MNSTVSRIKVSDTGKCCFCHSADIIKNDKTNTGKQQYYCKACGKRFIDYYTYCAYIPTTDSQIIVLTKEGLGIRSIARVLHISTTTLLKRVLRIANNIASPHIIKGKSYEVDEIRTYVKLKNKLMWIVYALERETKQVNVGSRTNKTLKAVLTTLILSKAKRIYTDKLPSYRYLIPKQLHRISIYGTNHIERMNLTLRTHLKRLNRRTICFSKSVAMLIACLKIYFWGISCSVL